MSQIIEIQPASGRELVICRLIDAPPEKVYLAWTHPELMRQWFAPLPWQTTHAELDVRVGGSSLIVMKGPDGNEFPNRGVYLEVVPNRKLVFTDAFVSAWQPSDSPFMTVELTFEREGDKTRYTARARHWTAEACAQHAQMGFVDGWGKCADQLEAAVQKL